MGPRNDDARKGGLVPYVAKGPRISVLSLRGARILGDVAISGTERPYETGIRERQKRDCYGAKKQPLAMTNHGGSEIASAPYGPRNDGTGGHGALQ